MSAQERAEALAAIAAVAPTNQKSFLADQTVSEQELELATNAAVACFESAVSEIEDVQFEVSGPRWSTSRLAFNFTYRVAFSNTDEFSENQPVIEQRSPITGCA